MEGKEDRGETGNIFFCYPLWLFRSHLIVVPRFQWGRPILVRAWSCITTVQLLERLFPLPTRVLPWSYRSEHWYKVTILSILKNVAGKRNNSPLSELSSLNLSPLYATQEIWSQVSGMTKKGGAGSDRKAIVVQKMAYFTATIEQTSAKASTSVVMFPTQLRQTSLCLQANYCSCNIFLLYLPGPAVHYALTYYPDGSNSAQFNANILTCPGISGSTYTYLRPEAEICAPLTEFLLELRLQRPICLGIQRDATSPLGVG